MNATRRNVLRKHGARRGNGVQTLTTIPLPTISQRNRRTKIRKKVFVCGQYITRIGVERCDNSHCNILNVAHKTTMDVCGAARMRITLYPRTISKRYGACDRTFVIVFCLLQSDGTDRALEFCLPLPTMDEWKKLMTSEILNHPFEYILRQSARAMPQPLQSVPLSSLAASLLAPRYPRCPASAPSHLVTSSVWALP